MLWALCMSNSNIDPGHIDTGCFTEENRQYLQTLMKGLGMDGDTPRQMSGLTLYDPAVPDAATLTINNNVLYLNGLALAVPIVAQVDVPTAPGYTIDIANSTTVELIYQEGGAGGASGVTINFPSSPIVNQRLVIATVQSIAGMTLQPGYQIGAPPTSMPANSSIEFLWLSGRWNRLR